MNMTRKIFVAAVLAFASSFAFAQQPPAPAVATSDPTTAQQVQGNTAGATADMGSPVKVGCVYNTTLPTYLNLQRTDCQSDISGNVRVRLLAGTATAADGVTNNGVVTVGGTSDVGTVTATGRPVLTASYFFNGTTWDRARSVTTDGLGTPGFQAVVPLQFNGTGYDRPYTCNNTAIVNVTAAATTEIVPLTGGQIIRVCSFSMAMSAAGTAQFINGTGSNCGTGTASLTGAMPLATGTPWSLSGSQGNVFRATISNALCVAAVTGNVVGFVTYAKY